MIVAFVAGLVFTIATAMPLTGAWVHWDASRPIETRRTAQPMLVAFALPVAVYGSAQPGLADVRIVDDTGKEVPYVIDAQEARPLAVWSDARIFDTGFVPGQYTQVVADVGDGRAPHNLLEILASAADGDFFNWAAVDASDDGRNWRIVRDRAPIFRFEADGIKGQLQVSFPETHSRFLRVRILDGRRPFGIDGVSVSNEVETKTSRSIVAAHAIPNSRAPAQKSWWDADTGINNAPVSAVGFSASQSAFHRLVTVSSSADGESWDDEAQAYIYRDNGSSQMLVEVPSGQARYWRVTVFNRNDAPIQGLSIHLLTIPQYVVFRQEPGRSYRLVYGNSRAQAPEYDFATLTTREQRDAAPRVAVGAESSNAAYLSPEPWTERHAWILWAALLAAVIVVAALAIRSMR